MTMLRIAVTILVGALVALLISCAGLGPSSKTPESQASEPKLDDEIKMGSGVAQTKNERVQVHQAEPVDAGSDMESGLSVAERDVEPVMESSDATQATEATMPPGNTILAVEPIEKLCEEIGAKLDSVTVQECLDRGLQISDGWSVQGRPIAVSEFLADAQDAVQPKRIPLVGGIHGDEYSSVTIVFRWMELLAQNRSENLDWLVVPLANPDGLLRKRSQRQNAQGVDLNRNFPTALWEQNAISQWRTRYRENPRRYPGSKPGSEPEVAWLVSQINAFQPHIIISVHAPHGLLDYDGPPTAPKKIGSLGLNRLGVYPGSLGNYAGVDLDIPVVTIELPHAGIMPTAKEVRSMWQDLNAWLIKRLNETTDVALQVAG